MKRLITTTLLLLFSLFSYAETEKIALKDVHHYMALSGIEELVDAMPSQIAMAQQQRQLTSKDPDIEREVIDILQSQWKIEEIKQTLAVYLQKNESASVINELIRWQKSPLARKISDAESQAYLPEFQSEMLRYLADLQATPPLPETRDAILRLVESAEMVDMSVEVMINVMNVMLHSFSQADQSFAESATDLDIQQQIDNMRDMMTGVMEEQVILMSYYLYRNLSNDDIHSYAKFYESPLGKKELKLVFDALNVSIQTWAQSSTALLANLAAQMQTQE